MYVNNVINHTIMSKVQYIYPSATSFTHEFAITDYALTQFSTSLVNLRNISAGIYQIIVRTGRGSKATIIEKVQQ